MGITPQIEKLIIKFLNRNISILEEEHLSEWLILPENEQEFAEYIKTHHAITSQSINASFLDQSKRSLLFKEPEIAKLTSSYNNPVKVKKLNTSAFVRYAAAIIVIGLIFTCFILNNNNERISSIAQTSIQPGSNKAILTLNNGKEIDLDSSPFSSNGISAENGKIIYNSTTLAEIKQTLEYNYLTVPRGGQYLLQLSDSTNIWLNSESKLKYPTRFVSGQTREIELLYGEAYFDVTSSELCNGASFKVKSSTQLIEVLGTEFNIKSYNNENMVYTTLIEGKVNVASNTSKTMLKPNQQYIYNKKTKTFSVNDITATTEILWKDGVFSFKGKTLKELMVVISRWYNIDVVFEHQEIESIKFNGAINKDKKIESILEIIKYQAGIEYRIENKTIILK